MIALSRGRYEVREAVCKSEIEEAQALRARCFGVSAVRDADDFDACSLHVLVRDTRGGTPVCCFRLMLLDAADLPRSYAAQYYELSALQRFEGRMLELGRFCVDPAWRDPDILRGAWAAITGFVDANDVRLLFGCSSFAGIDEEDYLDAFAMLSARHLAPARWLPQVKAPHVFRFAAKVRPKPDLKKAMLRMPPLLRSYLLMGGWVSDHAVVDAQMNTMHVFTGLEIGSIPPARKRLLRALA